MSSLQLFQPASQQEAHALLARSSMPVDSPTQRRIRSDENLTEYFGTGRRRPAWVWGVRRDDDPAAFGVVAAFGTPDDRLLLDVFGLPDDPEAARMLIEQATDAVTGHEEEALLFAPPGATVDDASLASVVNPLRAAGW